MAEWQSSTTALEIPEQLLTPIETANNVISVILALLNVALAILNVVRAFAFGVLDPLTAALNALINALEGLLNDFRQVGVYMHGDWYLLDFPPEDLRGGFKSYQRRMTARLLDSEDPNRPNFSPATAGVAVFFYGNAPVTQLGNLIRFIGALTRLFRQEPRGSVLPSVSGLSVGYGYENFSFFSLSPSGAVETERVDALGVAEIANLSWEVVAPSRINPRRPAVVPPSKGFLVELSTVQDGLLLAFSRPVRDNTQDGEGNQNRISGYYTDLDGNPIRLYGGADQIELDGVDWNSTMSSSGVRSGARQAYALINPADTTPIPLELLQDEGDYLLQRTFYVPAKTGARLMLNQKFGARLHKDDMPYEADFEVQDDGTVRVVPGSKRKADAVWARVVAVSNDVDTAQDWKYQISPVITDLSVTNVAGDLGFEDRGVPSSPVQISFPTETTTKYLLAIETALAVLLLSRSDIPADVRGRRLPKVSAPTGLESASEVFSTQVSGVSPTRYFKRKTKSEKFRKGLRRRIRDVSNSIYRNSGRLPESFKERVVASVEEDLLLWKWSDSEALSATEASLVPDATIMDSLRPPYASRVSGVCRNPNSIGVWSRSEDEHPLRQIKIGASQRGVGVKDALSRSDFRDSELLDSIPMMFGMSEEGPPLRSAVVSGSFWTCRELFDDRVYEAAEYVLRVAGAPSEPVEGGWIALRLFPRGLPAVERLFSEVIEWAESFKQGAKGLVDAVLEYIDFVEARITELQELLMRLQSYLNFANGLYVPSGSYLVVTGQGTEGLLNEFLAAANPPSDTSLDYGGGIVLVAGGLPDLIFDLLSTIVSPESA